MKNGLWNSYLMNISFSSKISSFFSPLAKLENEKIANPVFFSFFLFFSFPFFRVINWKIQQCNKDPSNPSNVIWLGRKSILFARKIENTMDEIGDDRIVIWLPIRELGNYLLWSYIYSQFDWGNTNWGTFWAFCQEKIEITIETKGGCWGFAKVEKNI